MKRTLVMKLVILLTVVLVVVPMARANCSSSFTTTIVKYYEASTNYHPLRNGMRLPNRFAQFALKAQDASAPSRFGEHYTSPTTIVFSRSTRH